MTDHEPDNDMTTPPARAALDSADWAVSAGQTTVWEDDFHVLHVTVDGVDHEDVRPRRAFPVSSKSRHVSFLGPKGVEVVLLRDPEALDAKSRRTLRAALNRVYYVATILRVHDITEAMGVSLWEAETDRGFATFEISDRNRFIRILPNGRYLITDVDGNRFEIRDVRALDPRSQALVATET